MSNNYRTSKQASLLRQRYVFEVTMEDLESGALTTFGVTDFTASVATARTMAYIDENRIPVGDQGYALTPRIVKYYDQKKFKPNYQIP